MERGDALESLLGLSHRGEGGPVRVAAEDEVDRRRREEDDILERHHRERHRQASCMGIFCVRFWFLIILALGIVALVIAANNRHVNERQDLKDMQLMNNVSDLDERVTTLEGAILAQTGNSSSLAAVVADNTARIIVLENRTDAQDQQIAELDTKAAGLMANITGVQSEVEFLINLAVPTLTNKSSTLMMGLMIVEDEAFTHIEPGFGASLSVSPTPTPTGIGRTLRADLDAVAGFGITISPSPGVPGPATWDINVTQATPAVCGSDVCPTSLAEAPGAGPVLAPVVCAEGVCASGVLDGITGNATLLTQLTDNVCPVCALGGSVDYLGDIGPASNVVGDELIFQGSTVAGTQGIVVRSAAVNPNQLDFEVNSTLMIPTLAASPTFAPTVAPILAPDICAAPACAAPNAVRQVTHDDLGTFSAPASGSYIITGSSTAGSRGVTTAVAPTGTTIELDYSATTGVVAELIAPTVLPTLAPSICASPTCAPTVTLGSEAGATSLISDGTAPSFTLKSLNAGLGTTITSTATAITINGVSPLPVATTAAYWCQESKPKWCMRLLAIPPGGVAASTPCAVPAITRTEIGPNLSLVHVSPVPVTCFNAELDGCSGFALTFLLCGGTSVPAETCGLATCASLGFPTRQNTLQRPHTTAGVWDNGNNRLPLAITLLAGGQIEMSIIPGNSAGVGSNSLIGISGFSFLYVHGL